MIHNPSTLYNVPIQFIFFKRPCMYIECCMYILHMPKNSVKYCNGSISLVGSQQATTPTRPAPSSTTGPSTTTSPPSSTAAASATAAAWDWTLCPRTWPRRTDSNTQPWMTMGWPVLRLERGRIWCWTWPGVMTSSSSSGSVEQNITITRI